MIDSLNDCQLRAAVHQWPDMFKARSYTRQHIYPTAGMAVGTAAHESVAHILKHKMVSGALGSVDEAVDIGKAKFAKEIEGGFQTDVITRSVGDATDQIAIITRTFSGLVGYKIMPSFVEKQFNSTIQDGWLLTGRIDYVTDTLDNPDLKTGRISRLYLGQSGAYSLTLRSNGIVPRRSGILHIRRTGKLENPAEPIPYWYDRVTAENYARATMKRAIIAVEKFEATGDLNAFAINSSSWACSAKSCAAWGFCPAGKAKESGSGSNN